MKMLKIVIQITLHISMFFLGWGLMGVYMKKGSEGLVDGNGVFFVVSSILMIAISLWTRIVIWIYLERNRIGAKL